MTSPLLPGPSDRAAAFGLTIEKLDELFETLPNMPIGPRLSRDEIAARLSEFNFDRASGLELSVTAAIDLLRDGIVHSAHPRCFGLFNPTPAFHGVLGELIAAAFNPQLAVWSHAPAAVEIEKHVIRQIAARFGWVDPDACGHFATGGAEANLTAVVVALTRAFPAYGDNGVASLSRQPVLYASADSHVAWFKIAHLTGIGRDAVRLVATSGDGRLDPVALETAIDTDLAAGRAPFMVVATAGTTNAGMIDPLTECASVAERRDLWLHVDAAWGGAVVCSDRLKPILSGIERGHSITVDAHKWFSAPMGAGMFLCRDPELLARPFRVAATYMPSRNALDDPYLNSVQWSRRFIGLKLFLSLASVGWKGHALAIEGQITIAELLRRRLNDERWRVLNDSPLGVICFILDTQSGDIDGIVAGVQNEQTCWISAAEFEGRRVIRACITSFRTRRDDVEALIAALERARIRSNADPSFRR
jgi:aromatic-L-amino-acid/L-tryptophan decarboxylase